MSDTEVEVKQTAVQSVNETPEYFYNLAQEYAHNNYPSLTKEQFNLFVATARECCLNPVKREVYAVVYNDYKSGEKKMNIITGYEVYLKRAERTGKLNGWECHTDGQGNQMKAVVTIDRKDWEHPFKHEVYMSEYNTGKSLWASKPITMLKKVAMAQAFRLAFPDELGGMPYTSDELGTDEQAERNVTPQKPQAVTGEETKPAEPKQVETPKPEEKKPPVEGMTTANKIAPHCTPMQAEEMKKLFASTYPDGTPVMADDEKEMFRAMGRSKSMQDTITSCKKYVADKLAQYKPQTAPKPEQVKPIPEEIF
jgi:phage recombination protein Bet